MKTRSRWKVEKKKALRKARTKLRDSYGVRLDQVQGIRGILKQIALYRPDLDLLEGMSRVAAFVGVVLPERPPKVWEPKVTKQPRPSRDFVASDSFLQSYEWRRVRMQALKKYGARCQCCGATPSDGLRINVDHIKPRKLFPQLALDVNNLQVLCEECNHGKGNWDMTDWRPPEHVDNGAAAHIRAIVEGE